MRPAVVTLAAALCVTSATPAALTREDFMVTTAGDLLDLCSVPETDPAYERATAFCHGFVTGVVRYHDAMTPDPRTDLYCLPEPKPTRQQGIAQFVAWAKAHPQLASEQPVDVLFKFLIDAYPCKRGQ